MIIIKIINKYNDKLLLLLLLLLLYITMNKNLINK